MYLNLNNIKNIYLLNIIPFEDKLSCNNLNHEINANMKRKKKERVDNLISMDRRG